LAPGRQKREGICQKGEVDLDYDKYDWLQNGTVFIAALVYNNRKGETVRTRLVLLESEITWTAPAGARWSSIFGFLLSPIFPSVRPFVSLPFLSLPIVLSFFHFCLVLAHAPFGRLVYINTPKLPLPGNIRVNQSFLSTGVSAMRPRVLTIDGSVDREYVGSERQIRKAPIMSLSAVVASFCLGGPESDTRCAFEEQTGEHRPAG
jgi:hypothetical protein